MKPSLVLVAVLLFVMQWIAVAFFGWGVEGVRFGIVETPVELVNSAGFILLLILIGAAHLAVMVLAACFIPQVSRLYPKTQAQEYGYRRSSGRAYAHAVLLLPLLFAAGSVLVGLAVHEVGEAAAPSLPAVTSEPASDVLKYGGAVLVLLGQGAFFLSLWRVGWLSPRRGAVLMILCLLVGGVMQALPMYEGVRWQL